MFWIVGILPSVQGSADLQGLIGSLTWPDPFLIRLKWPVLTRNPIRPQLTCLPRLVVLAPISMVLLFMVMVLLLIYWKMKIAEDISYSVPEESLSCY